MLLAPAPDTDDVTVAESDCNLLLIRTTVVAPKVWLEIFLRDFVLSALVLPVNRKNPPAFAVIKKLKAVDAAHEWCGIAWIVTRFVRAPNVSDPAKLFGAPRDFCFVKTLLKKWFCSRDILFDIQHLRLKIDVVSSRDARSGHDSRAGIKQGPLAIPVAFLSSRSGDHVIRRSDDCVDRLDVRGIDC